MAVTPLRPMNAATESAGLPFRSRACRLRQPSPISVATSARAIRTEVQGPATLTRKPLARSWNTSGNGPTEVPWSSTCVRPRNTIMPARVTMKLGMAR